LRISLLSSWPSARAVAAGLEAVVVVPAVVLPVAMVVEMVK
jgi:hypothetical protein